MIKKYKCDDHILEDKRLIINPKVIEKFMSTTNKPAETNGTTAQTNEGAEYKDQNIKYVLSKFEYDLYHEEDNKIEKVIRVKRISMPNKGEKWKILDDGKTAFVVEGTKLAKKEKEFLRTVEGVNFLIKQYKSGIRSFNALKNEIKKQLK